MPIIYLDKIPGTRPLICYVDNNKSKHSLRASQISAGNILHQPFQLPCAIVQNIWIDHIAESFVCIFENCPNLKNVAICCQTFTYLAHASSQSTLIQLSNEAMSRKQDLHLLFIIREDVTSEAVDLFQTMMHPSSFTHDCDTPG